MPPRFGHADGTTIHCLSAGQLCFSSTADPSSRIGSVATGCDRPRTNVHAALAGEITHPNGRTVKSACTHALQKTYLDLQLAGTRHYRDTLILLLSHLTDLVTFDQVYPQ
jgi:hypothetical protein